MDKQHPQLMLQVFVSIVILYVVFLHVQREIDDLQGLMCSFE